jgi:hypothetical protein
MFIALEGEKLSWHLLRIIQDAIGRYEYRISQRPRLAFSAGGDWQSPWGPRIELYSGRSAALYGADYTERRLFARVPIRKRGLVAFAPEEGRIAVRISCFVRCPP